MFCPKDKEVLKKPKGNLKRVPALVGTHDTHLLVKAKTSQR